MILSIIWYNIFGSDKKESTLRFYSTIETGILGILVLVGSVTMNTLFTTLLGMTLFPALVIATVSQFQLAKKQLEIENLEEMASNSFGFEYRGANMAFMDLNPTGEREIGKTYSLGNTGIEIELDENDKLIGINALFAKINLVDDVVENLIHEDN